MKRVAGYDYSFASGKAVSGQPPFDLAATWSHHGYQTKFLDTLQYRKTN